MHRYCTVPYRTVPCRIVPYHNAPHRTAPYRTVPYCTIARSLHRSVVWSLVCSAARSHDRSVAPSLSRLVAGSQAVYTRGENITNWGDHYVSKSGRLRQCEPASHVCTQQPKNIITYFRHQQMSYHDITCNKESKRQKPLTCDCRENKNDVSLMLVTHGENKTVPC